MKNSIKTGFATLVLITALTACSSHKTPSSIDSAKVDSIKKDSISKVDSVKKDSAKVHEIKK